MCGIVGIAVQTGAKASFDSRAILRVAERLAHRGPDSAGAWEVPGFCFAHRRLAVIDTSPAGAQPMGLWELDSGALLTAPLVGPAARSDLGTPRFVLAYNGELYNDAPLRTRLARRGARFTGACDAETLLHAWAAWGTQALAHVRGMFAFAIADTRQRTLTLVRDPLGVKPLFYARTSRELMFASEPRSILDHPEIIAAPNARMVSAYLTTIWTTLAGETMFQGVRALGPGQMLVVDLAGSGAPPAARELTWWRGPAVAPEAAVDPAEALASVREALRRSVHEQMRADVPVCALLSGGLDSTIVAALARDHSPTLRTYAAGAPVPEDCASLPQSDLCFARRAAEHLGVAHDQAHVTRDSFRAAWPGLIDRLALPLSTPNQVAIHDVAARLRADGCIVTLSGEGADELFAGYDRVIDAARRHAADPHASSPGPALFLLAENAWTPLDFKHGVLSERAFESTEHDRWLRDQYENELALAREEAGSDGIEAQLRMVRRINLTGLLQRLDTSTMLAGVEGRTPFADADVALAAERLPLSLKYAPEPAAEPAAAAATAAAPAALLAAPPRTKLILRRAFEDRVPRFVLDRPKASFPLPFQAWVADHAAVLRTSNIAREFFSDAAIHAVTAEPARLWRLAWPMINIAYWGRSMGW
ncbi:MAG: asparagine synthase (glutamine-hydrolyzing) [Planctomycetota bacterium]|nr:asparagine synthase (glutamine-hydrolyzing) [Planctomycetota bacterium]